MFGNSRKRPRPEEVINDFQSALNRDLGGLETNPLDAPSSKSQLFGNDGSSTRTVGQQDTLARKSRIEPPFRGAGPGAPVINGLSLFNPRPGPMDKPTFADVVYFQDDSERTYGWSVNDSLVYYKNAKMVRRDYGFTLRCVTVKQQGLFVYRDDAVTASEEGDAMDDAKLASISMVNLMLEEGSEPDSKEPYTRIEDVLDQWVFWGVYNNVLFSSQSRTRKMPIVNAVVQGYVKCAHYWAGYPIRARNGSWVGFYLARRPKDRKVAGHYRDLLYKMLSIDLGTSPTKANKRKVTELMEERNMLDMSLPDSECKFVWEPYVTHTREKPPQFLYSGPGGDKPGGWEGYPQAWGFIISGTSGAGEPECYRQAVERALYPTCDSLETMDNAFFALPSIEFAVFP